MLRLVSAADGHPLGSPGLLALIDIPPRLGYLAVAALVGVESMGVPAPGETAVLAASLLANRGRLQIEVVIAMAAAGAIVGDNIGYLIGRHGGRRLLERPGWLHARRLTLLAYGDRFFARHGAKAVFFGRWITIARVTAAWMAGANRMPFPRFFLWNALGGVTWAITVGAVGYLLGAAGERLLKHLGVAAAIGFGVAVVGAFVWWRVRERRAVRRDMGTEP